MYYKLESLRGVMACMVVLFHTRTAPFGLTIAIVENAYLFVDFFFILSGFVMTYTYHGKISNGFEFRNYLILRLGRIYPLHLFILFAWVPYILVKQYLYTQGLGSVEPFATSNIYSFISNIFLIQSIHVHDYLGWNIQSWSISTELFTYIIFFFVTLTFDKKLTILVPLIISLFSYFIITSLDRNTMDITYDYGLIRCVAGFYLGVMTYRLSKHQKISGFNINIGEILVTGLMIISVSLASQHQYFPLLALMTFSLTVLIFSSKRSGFLGQMLESKLLTTIGLWSYSIYMTHGIIVDILSNAFEYFLDDPISHLSVGVSLVLNGIVLSIVFLVSKYTYQYIESPFRNKSRKLISR